MIPITYHYQCSCGYAHTQQEHLTGGAYARLLIDQVLLCPCCQKRLQPTVAVTYKALQPPTFDEIMDQKIHDALQHGN